MLKNIPLASMLMTQSGRRPIDEWTKIQSHKNIQADYIKIQKQLENGTSLVLSSLHRHIPKLNQFIYALRAELQSKVWANVYITPPNSQAFKLHYDTHDVFVLQIQGTKKWSMYNAPIVLPDKSQSSKDYFPENEPEYIFEDEFTLEAGDLLYIPRGYGHQAKSTNVTSIHITVGITPLRVIDIWDSLKQKSIEKVAFRKSISLINGENDWDEESIKKLFIDIIKNTSINDLIEDSRLEQMPRILDGINPNILGGLINQDNINGDSLLLPRKDRIVQTSLEGYFCVLSINGVKKELPIFMKEIIEKILEAREGIKIKDLKSNYSERQKIELIKQLIKENFFTIC